MGFDGPWAKNVPTPNTQNVSGTWFSVIDPIEQSFTLVFPTEANATYTIQYNDSLSTTNWNPAATVIGDGIEKRYKEYFLSERYYRVLKN